MTSLNHEDFYFGITAPIVLSFLVNIHVEAMVRTVLKRNADRLTSLSKLAHRVLLMNLLKPL